MGSVYVKTFSENLDLFSLPQFNIFEWSCKLDKTFNGLWNIWALQDFNKL